MEKTNVTDTESVDTSIENTNDSDKKLANLVNAAVSSHMKRFMKQFESAQTEKQAATQAATQTSQAPAQSDDASDVRKELAKLRAELKAEKAKAREEKVFSDVRSRLSGKVRDDALDLALKVFRADQKIVIDEEGNTVFRHEGVDHEMEDGIDEWLQSKEASVFRPAPTQKKVPGKTQVKAPSRMGPGNSEIKDPLQRAKAQMDALGISI